ncbi:MAG: TRAP transporter small permease subunit [Saprospiraceae bacterium]|nr:TRAP transporter small permease subunit [Saprospiraceae bacterium]
MAGHSTTIEKWTQRTGSAVSWLTMALVILMTTDVFLRYLFRVSRTWILDLEWHFFALIFLWGASATWLEDKHVRVDLFYHSWPDRRKKWVNVLGTLFFLLPWCFMLIITGLPYAFSSWEVGEGSPDPNGLPARYLIKIAMVAGFVLLGLSGIGRMVTDLRDLRSKSDSST